VGQPVTNVGVGGEKKGKSGKIQSVRDPVYTCEKRWIGAGVEKNQQGKIDGNLRKRVSERRWNPGDSFG